MSLEPKHRKSHTNPPETADECCHGRVTDDHQLARTWREVCGQLVQLGRYLLTNTPATLRFVFLVASAALLLRFVLPWDEIDKFVEVIVPVAR